MTHVLKSVSKRFAACSILFLACGFAYADDAINLGNTLPSAASVREGLFPNDECEQLKAAGFKCMGFKAPVRYSLPSVSFEVGSAELPSRLKAQLDVFALALKDKSGLERRVKVEGHADASGTPKANIELSQRRADAAKQYLVSKGVSEDMLVAVGVGANDLANDSNPLAPENRRVVIGRDGVGAH
jgi:outer membrane protein OmpA-like peptidoglycan-associated protein